MKKSIITLPIVIFCLLIIPSLVFASWWNPLSWFESEKITEEISIEISSSTPFASAEIKTESNWWNPLSWVKKETIVKQEITTTTEKTFSESENKKVETRNETQNTENEKTQMELETTKAKAIEMEIAKAKAEAEKYKLEAEKIKLETEKLKQENEAQKREAEIQVQAEVKKEENKNTTATLPNGAIVEMDEYGNIVKTIKEAEIKPDTEIINTKNETLPLQGTKEVFIDARCDKNTIESVRATGIVDIGNFILENNTSDDIDITNITISINRDFSKNLISPVELLIQFPIDLFGVSKKDIFGKKDFEQSCTTEPMGGGQFQTKCDDNKLNLFENISFDLSTTVKLENNKQIKIYIHSQIAGAFSNCGPSCFYKTNSIAGEYKETVILKSCIGYGIETNKEFKCNPENVHSNALSVTK